MSEQLPKIENTPESVEKIYKHAAARLTEIKTRLKRPLILAEKILFSHLSSLDDLEQIKRGDSYLMLNPDRVAMQDATAQMALLQFMLSGRKTTAVPSTVHCDHLIEARVDAEKDMETALDTNREVYDFLESVSGRYGVGFWKPGAGIIHQVVLENYAMPGALMIGTDSHTPNAGGLGMIAVGVGGADAVDVMSGFPWEVKMPKFIGVHLKGKLNGWTSPKDVILYLCGLLTTKGGTNKIVEYFGEGCESISCTGKGTITNMGAELGATTSLFPYDSRMESYLKVTDRAFIADLANTYKDCLTPDAEVVANPKDFYDEVIEIDLDKLEPYIVGPHSPDVARPLSKMASDCAKEGYPTRLSAALIGSCTNSSYEDIGRATHVAKQALVAGGKMPQHFLVTPGSDKIFETIKRDGQMEVLERVGATVMANACGPCIGQWRRDDIKMGERNSILTSFNRNFRGRNDANAETLSFIGSPEIVMALGLAGRLDFNPMKDELEVGGKKIKLEAPSAPELPTSFAKAESGYVGSSQERLKNRVAVKDDSDRLQLLTPFEGWNGEDYLELPLLIKCKGKTTTDHISPAGKWLKYRGHLDNISDNMFLTAVNAYTDEPGKVKNQLTEEKSQSVSQVARDYKAKGFRWAVVGDENYGEGSSREHAAMCPRLLGAAAVVVKSFARIHETNLKKQGVLPLTFVNPSDYDLVQEADKISVLGLSGLTPGKDLTLRLTKADGSQKEFAVRHTMNAEQIEWFKAGSALNVIRNSLGNV
ncbi:aconitate hydratase [bacterium]|nr:aconitate hydratase [bacterium]